MATYQDLFNQSKQLYKVAKPYATLQPTAKNIVNITKQLATPKAPAQPRVATQGYSNAIDTDAAEMKRLASLQPTQTPTTPTTPATPTVGGFDFGNYSTSLTNYLNAIKPQTPEERIKQQQTYYELLKQQYDPQVAATTAVYGDILARQQELSKGAIGQTRAMASAAGLIGTPMGQAQVQRTAERQANIEKAIDMEKGVKIQQILGEAQIISQKMAEADVLAKMNYADKALAIQKEAISQAKTNLFDLAKSGYGWDAQTKQLAEQAGYTGDLAEVLYKASMPTEGAIDWKTVNVGDGKVLFYGVNPQTGQLEQKTTDVNVPQGYKTTFANGQMYYVPEKNEEGDLTGAIKYESESDKKFRQSKELEYLKSSLNISEAEAKNRIESASGKKFTDAQNQAATYGVRIKQAEDTFSQIGNNISKMNPAAFQVNIRMPNSQQPDEIQRYLQASQNFINAQLRRESGAAIAPTEYENARKQYLPVAGDTPEVLRQKAENRRIVLEGLKQSSNGAYDYLNQTLYQPTQSTPDYNDYLDYLNTINQ